MLFDDREAAFDDVQASALVRLDFHELAENFRMALLCRGNCRHGIGGLNASQPSAAAVHELAPEMALETQTFAQGALAWVGQIVARDETIAGSFEVFRLLPGLLAYIISVPTPALAICR
jgi:hypothetical protein